MGYWITDSTVVDRAYDRVLHKIRKIERRIHKGGSTQARQHALHRAEDQLCDLQTVKNLAEYMRNLGRAHVAQFP